MLRKIQLIVLSALIANGVASFAQQPNISGIGENARLQILEIEKEKQSFTPIQRKLDRHFVHELKKRRGQLPAILAEIPAGIKFGTNDRVLVDIDAEITDDLLQQIQQAGGTIIASVPQFHSLRAEIPMDALESLAALTNVTFIKQAAQARTRTGSVESQGDFTHGAIGARTNFGVDGSGIKVGVLSDSVKNLSTSQSTGDLPTNVVVLPGQSGTSISGNEGEGTAMLEIVHDLAPGAQLYFATAFASEASFAQNILSLRSNGCNIIIDDVAYFDEPVFQDGIVAQSVNAVTAGGALYFSSAGNGGRLDAGTGAVWEGDFVDGGAVGSPISKLESGRVHSFGANTYDVAQGLGSSTFQITLFWSDPWGASTNDYDLFVLNSTGTSVASYGAGPQTGTQNPYEICNVKNGQRIVIVKYSGANRFLHLELESNGYGTLSVATGGDTRGHPTATNAFCVAAVDVHQAFPNLFSAASTNENFSSDGPRRVFFQASGAPITPGNFSSTGGTIRWKPDISAADGVSNSVAGFNPFYGTSAAAPHAGAVAALVWSYNPALTASQMRTVLTNTAIDIDAPGWDRNSGFGIVMPGAAIQSLISTSPPPPVANFSADPTNGAVPLVVTFDNSSSYATNYVWKFGDGQTNSLTNPTHTYTNAGIFTVLLTATGAGGTTNFARTNYIVVTNVPPMIIKPPQSLTLLAGSDATFSVIATGTDPLSYQWQFNSTNISGATTNSFTRTNAQPVDAGNYSVVITNMAGSITSIVTTLTVTNAPPVADFMAGPTNGAAPLAVNFTNLSSGATNFLWDFGDGQTNGSVSPTNIYHNQGNYTVSLTAFGLGGQTTIVKNNFIVLSNSPPLLQAISNQTILETTLLTFTNIASDADANQHLNFSLDANAPAGAEINPTNGVFAWTPTEAQGPTTNQISVVVTDDGAPPLSATQSFVVIILESNLPPVLVPIADKIIYAGMTLTITNFAADPDIPANALAFSLSNSPAGAEINATNGVLTWTPDNSFANTTNALTVVVTDDNPSAVNAQHLSDFKTLSVFVAPPPTFLFWQPIGVTNGDVTISWNSISGLTYRVQFSTNLGDGNWFDLPPDVTATDSVAAKIDLSATNSFRFYRILPLQ